MGVHLVGLGHPQLGVEVVNVRNSFVLVAVSLGNGLFAATRFVDIGFVAGAGYHLADVNADRRGIDQGWAVDRHVRAAADITGDGRADMVGFGNDAVWTAVTTP